MMSRIGRLFGGFRRKTRDDEVAEERSPIAWVVAGLGNPGKEYAGSRHNTGHMVLDRIARAKHVEFGRKRFNGVTAEVDIGAHRTILVKPETYYNRSGDCISALLGYFKVPAERLIVVHDELDLGPGRIQIKSGGGHAGNNGIRSIIESLGTQDFIRVRVGIGKPPPGDADHGHILRPVHRGGSGNPDATLDRAVEAVQSIVTHGLSRAMGQYNQRSNDSPQ
jgi:PTH1 family peptidyl-tRNA hydrolase